MGGAILIGLCLPRFPSSRPKSTLAFYITIILSHSSGTRSRLDDTFAGVLPTTKVVTCNRYKLHQQNTSYKKPRNSQVNVFDMS